MPGLEHMPVWAQSLAGIFLALGFLIYGIVFAKGRGVKLLTSGLTSTEYQALLAKIETRASAEEMVVLEEKVEEYNSILHRLELGMSTRVGVVETAIAVISEWRKSQEDWQRAQDRRLDEFDRRRFPRRDP